MRTACSIWLETWESGAGIGMMGTGTSSLVRRTMIIEARPLLKQTELYVEEVGTTKALNVPRRDISTTTQFRATPQLGFDA